MGAGSNWVRSGDCPGVAKKVLSWKIRTSQNGQSLRLAFLDVKKLPVGRRTMPVGPKNFLSNVFSHRTSVSEIRTRSSWIQSPDWRVEDNSSRWPGRILFPQKNSPHP